MTPEQQQQFIALQQQVATLTSKLATATYRLNTHKHNLSDLTQKIPPTLPIVLQDAATINTDASGGSYFQVTLGGNRTLGNPTGATDGQRMVFEIIQDSTGSRTLAYGTAFAFGTGISSITLTTAAGKRDFIGVIYRATTQLFYIVAFANGY